MLDINHHYQTEQSYYYNLKCKVKGTKFQIEFQIEIQFPHMRASFI